MCSFLSTIQDMKVYPEEKDRIEWNLRRVASHLNPSMVY